MQRMQAPRASCTLALVTARLRAYAPSVISERSMQLVMMTNMRLQLQDCQTAPSHLPPPQGAVSTQTNVMTHHHY